MDPSVQVAIITSLFGLITLLATHMLKSHKAMNQVKEQVMNSHSTNLRDDVTTVLNKLDRVIHIQDKHTDDISLLRLDVSWNRHEMRDLSRRVHNIEEAA